MFAEGESEVSSVHILAGSWKKLREIDNKKIEVPIYMTIQYKETYLAMQQVQHANQIYEFMPSSLPIHVFESILPAQCLYKTKA